MFSLAAEIASFTLRVEAECSKSPEHKVRFMRADLATLRRLEAKIQEADAALVGPRPNVSFWTNERKALVAGLASTRASLEAALPPPAKPCPRCGSSAGAACDCIARDAWNSVIDRD